MCSRVQKRRIYATKRGWYSTGINVVLWRPGLSWRKATRISVQSNTAPVERAYPAWNAGQQQYADWISEAVAAKVKMHVPQGDLTGSDMYRAYYYEIHAAFPDGRVTVDELIAEGDTVIARYTFSGTNTGKLLTMPKITGKPASFVVIDVCGTWWTASSSSSGRRTTGWACLSTRIFAIPEDAQHGYKVRQTPHFS